MKVGERIRQRRIELDISQEELAKKLGYSSRTSISKIELDERKVPIEKLEAIAKALSTTSAWLMEWKSVEDKFLDEQTSPVSSEPIPVLGSVSCGKTVYANEEIGVEMSMLKDTRADFCFVAKDDSMINARIYEDDVVFVKKDAIINDGDIAVVIIGEDAIIRRVYFTKDEHKLVLQAENPKYQPLMFVGDELKSVIVLGKAVALQTKIR